MNDRKGSKAKPDGIGRQIARALLSGLADTLARPGERAAPADPDESVKLIHTRDLAGAGRFPRCQDHAGISLAEFKRQRRALREVEKLCKPVLEARALVASRDTDELLFAGSLDVRVPRSFLRKEVSIAMPPLPFATAVPVWREGRIAGGRLWARGGWRDRQASLLVECTSREKFAAEIAAARGCVSGATPAEQAAVQQLQASPFAAPVLFVSHRWRASHHPDPEGETLRRLLALGDAYLIVDYCSFPQPPFGPGDAHKLDQILGRMGELMHNVVVVHSDDYLTRGWLVYEYLCACLKRTLVCDEIRDERYLALHRWTHTKAPVPMDVFRDGVSGLKTNFIQESVLRSVNELLPQFREARYTKTEDRHRVRRMLRDELLRTLPPRRVHDPYLGETQSRPWKPAELDKAFDAELQWQEMDTSQTQPFGVQVAATLEEARSGRFRPTVQPSADYETTRALSSFRALSGDGQRVHSGMGSGVDWGVVDVDV